MRICFCTPQLPYPPEQGAAIRNYHLLRSAAEEHDVTLVSFAPDGAAIHDELRTLCDEVITAAPLPRPMPRRLAELALAAPDLLRRLRSHCLDTSVAEIIARRGAFDVVQVEGLEMWPVASKIPARRLVLDEHNAEFALQMSAARSESARRRWAPALYSLLQSVKLRRAEAAACQAASAVTAVSDVDASLLRALAPGAHVTVVPNGVDTDIYTPNYRKTRDRPDPDPVLLFAGKMDFRPNVEAVIWFARRVLPIIWGRLPRTRWIIFGMRPVAPVRELARDPRIEVTGYLPGADAELRLLADADVCVLPLLSGGGTKLKLLTAMSMAKAMVSTPTGISGVPLQHGEHVLVASSPQRFADQTITLLEDQELRSRLGSAARALAVKSYDWGAIGRQMARVYTADA